MRRYYYYKSLRKTIIQFLGLFDDIQIGRYNSSAVLQDLIEVPLKFGPKEKIWYWLNERKNDEMLPMNSVTMTSVAIATERITNKRHNILKSVTPSASSIERFLNPVPYNIGFTLSIWSLHMTDIDQILEQILPFFNPEIYMRVDIPELDANLDVKVLFESCSPDITDEMADDERRVLRWNIDFMVHTYVFQPLKMTWDLSNSTAWTIDTDYVVGDVVYINGNYYITKEDNTSTNTNKPGESSSTSNWEKYWDILESGNISLIKKIIAKIYTKENNFNTYLGTESTFTSGASGHESESIFIKGIPPYYDADQEKLYSYEIF